MSDELLEIVDNIKQPSVWIRILFMIVFVIGSYVLILPLIVILSIGQALFTLFTGKTNENLLYFAATLDLYASQVIKFLTYVSEEKPFPFSDLPEVEDNSLAEADSPKKKANGSGAKSDKSESSSEKKSSARTPAKKKAAKKKAPKKSASAKKASEKKADDEGDQES